MGIMKKGLKKQITSRKIKLLYDCKEGSKYPLKIHIDSTADQITAIEGHSRRSKIMSGVLKRFYHGLQCDIVLSDAIFKWLLDRCKADDSITLYLSLFEKWVSFSDKRSLSAQADTSTREMLNFIYRIEESGLEKRTVAAYRSVVRSWFGWLEDRNIIKKTPVNRDVKRAVRIDHSNIIKADGTRQALTFDETQKVTLWALKEPNPQKALAVLLQVLGALRSIEVVRLEKRNVVKVDDVYSVNVHGKGSRFRKIVLERPIVIALERCMKEMRRQGERGPLLVTPGGGKFNRDTIQRWAKEAAGIVGRTKDISSHDLRRTALTLLMEAGGTLDQVKTFAGHSDIATTARCYIVRNRKPFLTTGISPDTSETETDSTPTPGGS